MADARPGEVLAVFWSAAAELVDTAAGLTLRTEGIEILYRVEGEFGRFCGYGEAMAGEPYPVDRSMLSLPPDERDRVIGPLLPLIRRRRVPHARGGCGPADGAG